MVSSSCGPCWNKRAMHALSIERDIRNLRGSIAWSTWKFLGSFSLILRYCNWEYMHVTSIVWSFQQSIFQSFQHLHRHLTQYFCRTVVKRGMFLRGFLSLHLYMVQHLSATLNLPELVVLNQVFLLIQLIAHLPAQLHLLQVQLMIIRWFTVKFRFSKFTYFRTWSWKDPIVIIVSTFLVMRKYSLVWLLHRFAPFASRMRRTWPSVAAIR